MTTKTKAYDFPLSLRWLAGRRTLLTVQGKDELEVAPPPEFKGGVEGMWSPEDLLVGSVASCFAVTLLRIADQRAVPLRGLDVNASGHVEQRDDGRFGFTEAVLHVVVDTETGCEAEVAAAAEVAEQGCLVACSLDFPVRIDLDVRVAPLLGAAL
jgi:organic hydroperoxide reductase OsmC/OhrA